MSTYIVRRLIQSVIVLILVSIIVFLMLRLLPGDPLLFYKAQNQLDKLTPEQIAQLEADFGLDKSYPMQYFDWLGNILRGDFGDSLTRPGTVGSLMLDAIPKTLSVGIPSLILSGFFGILAGLIAALRRGTWLDTLMTSIANLGISVPIFWLGYMMILLFSQYLELLPVQGYTSPFEDFWLSIQKIIMPVICLSVLSFASNTRQTRSSMLEVIRQDYIRTAWSKGLRERSIVIKHVIKNGLIPVITLMGLQVSFIIGGAVLVEQVFNIPGMGRLMVQSVFSQDYPIVQGGSMVIASVITLTNLFIDISNARGTPCGSAGTR